MENRINVVFEISKLLDPEDSKNSWMQFVSDFIIDANNRCDFYFLLQSTDIQHLDSYQATLESTKNKILRIIRSKNELVYLDSIKFGLFNDPSKFEDKNSVWFFEHNNINNVIELLNKNSFFFFSDYIVGEFLHYSNFFTFLLDFDNLNEDEKKRKKVMKLSNGVIAKDIMNKINYAQISYEFLTFVESTK